jgi:hypothetical protein
MVIFSYRQAADPVDPRTRNGEALLASEPTSESESMQRVRCRMREGRQAAQ